jgi:hypothetical protein
MYGDSGVNLSVFFYSIGMEFAVVCLMKMGIEGVI